MKLNTIQGVGMIKAEITIAPFDKIAHYKTCETLQKVIWQAAPIEATPADLMITAHRHGGLALGAFDAQGEMIGCLFGFPGRVSKHNNIALAKGIEWQFCCHLVGVVEAWRGYGIGYQLAAAQRAWAIAEGFELITWTYDPLEIANAVLYIGKLGATGQLYLPNLYGEMPDELNADLPSDRLEVSWWLESYHVRERIAHGWQMASTTVSHRVPVNPEQGNTTSASDIRDALQNDKILLEIPTDIQTIKDTDQDLALAWRVNVRKAFAQIFEAGYRICDIVKEPTSPTARIYYVLEKSAL